MRIRRSIGEMEEEVEAKKAAALLLVAAAAPDGEQPRSCWTTVTWDRYVDCRLSTVDCRPAAAAAVNETALFFPSGPSMFVHHPSIHPSLDRVSLALSLWLKSLFKVASCWLVGYRKHDRLVLVLLMPFPDFSFSLSLSLSTSCVCMPAYECSYECRRVCVCVFLFRSTFWLLFLTDEVKARTSFTSFFICISLFLRLGSALMFVRRYSWPRTTRTCCWRSNLVIQTPEVVQSDNCRRRRCKLHNDFRFYF